MLVSIGRYEICDGTLAGGVAVSDLRVVGDRLYEFAVPVGDGGDPVMFDRITTTTDLTFTVKRTFANKPTCEKFILQLDTILPSTGTVTFTTTGPSPVTRVIPNGFVLDHSLVGEYGATAWHQYHIIGGPPVAP